MASRDGLAAVGAAESADRLLAEGAPLHDVWRFCILQLLDDYAGELRRSGVESAARRFSDRPPGTDSPVFDAALAALAALAEHLARADGWPVPDWAREASRYTRRWWFVTPLKGMHATALAQSPNSFRKRGVFITRDGLSRV